MAFYNIFFSLDQYDVYSINNSDKAVLINDTTQPQSQSDIFTFSITYIHDSGGNYVPLFSNNVDCLTNNDDKQFASLKTYNKPIYIDSYDFDSENKFQVFKYGDTLVYPQALINSGIINSSMIRNNISVFFYIERVASELPPSPSPTPSSTTTTTTTTTSLSNVEIALIIIGTFLVVIFVIVIGALIIGALYRTRRRSNVKEIQMIEVSSIDEK